MVYVNNGEKRLNRLLHMDVDKITVNMIKIKNCREKNKKRQKPTWKIWHEKMETKKNKNEKNNESKKIDEIMGDPRYWGC
ncbi:MAG: hypothetical protein QW153_03495 [Candidatus Bilamarchaeaceae archaeon]